jgi:peptidoglycan/LPS O-acetylase OafA/YrhL
LLRIALVNSGFGANAIYRLTPTRLDALAVGCLVAVLVRGPRPRQFLERKAILLVALTRALLAGIMGAALKGDLQSDPWVLTAGYTSFALFYGAIVLWSYLRSGSDAAGGLRSSTLRAFGKFSYALYVLHWPIAVYEVQILARSRSLPQVAQLATWIGLIVSGIALSFVLSLASWHLIEKRCLAFKRRFEVRFA